MWECEFVASSVQAQSMQNLVISPLSEIIKPADLTAVLYHIQRAHNTKWELERISVTKKLFLDLRNAYFFQALFANLAVRAQSRN